MTTSNISVTAPVGSAMERVKTMLFRPFDLGKWFVVGFCAWLATLGQQGFGGGGGFHQPWNGTNARHSLEQAKDYVVNNLNWLLPLVAAVVLVGLVVGVLIVWVSSRGQFMFLHCVALDKAEVAVPWNKFAREANSLFGFRLILGLGTLVLLLPFLVVAILIVIQMISQQNANVGGILGLIGIGFGVTVCSLVSFVISKFTRDFVVPLMFLRGGTCLAAWKSFRHLLAANVGLFVLYLLFQIVLSLVIFTLVVAVVLATCCLAGCLMAVPYLGTVLLLPVLVFQRTYSLQYLAQYGREYEVIGAAMS